jgi:hypothetical protein
MSEPLLDDLSEPDLGNRPRQPALWWWATGLGMAILLLAYNLLQYYIDLPYRVLDRLPVTTGALIIFTIFTGGTIGLVRGTLRYNPAVPPQRLALSALGSGILAETVFQMSRIFSILQDPSPYLLMQKGVLVLVAGLYCAAVAFGLTAYRQGRGIVPGLLAVVSWMVVGNLLLTLTRQGAASF